jgi:hypothetical protein
MGKPIAGKGQYPFIINGIVVDGAKINGISYVKTLYIYKQRSYNMYDLIDSDGNVFEFISITWRTETLIPLKYSDSSNFSVLLIKDNSFFIKTQDVSRNIYGFITLLQENKLKVSTGDYIFYDTNDDYSLLSVSSTPSSILAEIGDEVDLSVVFDPIDYSNTDGTWVFDDMVSEIQYSKKPFTSFICEKEGHAVVSFIPDANKKLTTQCQIFIKKKDVVPIELNSFIIMKNDPNDISGLNNVSVFIGQEFTITAIFEPFEYVPDEALTVSYDESVFEFIGTTDNINYKFNVIGEIRRGIISMTNGTLSANVSIDSNKDSTNGNIMITAPTEARVGNQFQCSISIYNYPSVDYTWRSSDESVISIDSNTGIATPLKIGTAQISVIGEGFTTNAFKSTVRVYDNVPNYINFSNATKFAYKPGQSIQLEAEYVPNTVQNIGRWNPVSNEFYTLTEGGLLTIIKAASNTSITYYDITYNTLGTGNYNPITLTQNGATLTFGIVVDYDWAPMRSFTAFGSPTQRYVPVGGITKTNISIGPTNTTIENRGFSIVVEDDTIVNVELVPKNTNTYRYPSINCYGLKRGFTNVTITPLDNPSLAITYKITTY